MRVGSLRPLFEVLSEQLCGLLVELWSLAWSLPGFEGAAFVKLLVVTLDRSAIDSEAPGGLRLGHALLYRLDDLLSEVQ